jgi:hypothetical protein
MGRRVRRLHLAHEADVPRRPAFRLRRCLRRPHDPISAARRPALLQVAARTSIGFLSRNSRPISALIFLRWSALPAATGHRFLRIALRIVTRQGCPGSDSPSCNSRRGGSSCLLVPLESIRRHRLIHHGGSVRATVAQAHKPPEFPVQVRDFDSRLLFSLIRL